jgi:hypothetical protein
MTDYYPLLARAVAGLERSTGEARRALYERARNALLAQLRGADPPLSESEITRERLALEEAVRRVEADAARQMRAPPPPPERPSAPLERPSAPLERPPAAVERPSPPLERPSSAPLERRSPPPGAASSRGGPPPFSPLPPRSDSEGTSALRSAPTVHPDNRGEQGLARLAERSSETRPSPRPSAAQALPATREAGVSSPPKAPFFDQLEQPPEPERPRRQARGDGPPGRPQETGEGHEGEAPSMGPRRRRPPGPLPRQAVDLQPSSGSAARRGLIAALLTVAIITGLGATAYWQRDTISGWFGASRSGAPPAARDQAQTRPKASDRVQQEGQAAQSEAGRPQTTPGGTPALVAQRVVLYEEDPANPEGNRYVGSALWRTETVSPGPGLSPELAVRADVEIPERRLAMTMSIRRNTDQALPASHTVEIIFNLPADFAFGGVANVPGLLMKEAEQARGAPLSGLAVKVTSGFFLIGLSAGEADLQRNMQLLKERGWFDIPMVYNNGRRAILAIEKGTPGERAFSDAFAGWGR